MLKVKISSQPCNWAGCQEFPGNLLFFCSKRRLPASGLIGFTQLLRFILCQTDAVFFFQLSLLYQCRCFLLEDNTQHLNQAVLGLAIAAFLSSYSASSDKLMPAPAILSSFYLDW